MEQGMNGRVRRALRRGAATLAAGCLLATGAAFGAESHGLRGVFYRGTAAHVDPSEGKAVLTRVDPCLALHWENQKDSTNRPPSEVGSYWWGARWTGRLTAPAAGTYVFRTTADDFARVLLDGRLVVDGWGLKSGQTVTGTPVELEAGRAYALAIDLYQNLGDVAIRLEWRPPGAAEFGVVPSDRLEPLAPEAPLVVTRTRLLARAGGEAGLAGGKITGSDAGPTTGFQTIATIGAAPTAGEWLDLSFTNSTVYRFVKYEAPPGSHASVAEVEFYHGAARLKGEGFGTVGARTEGATWERALDGDPATGFDAAEADNQYVGIDLGEGAQAAAPAFDPAPDGYPQGVYVRLSCPTPGAYIRYRLGETGPTADEGILYTCEFPVRADTTVTARAFKPGLADSVAAIGTYRFNVAPLRDGPNIFTTGNSLTGNAWALLPAIAESLGFRLPHGAVGAAGAPTDWLWANMADKARAEVDRKGPFDVYITHPFAGHGRSISNEVTATSNFFDLCLARNPKARLCLYQQWTGPDFKDRWAAGKGDDLSPFALQAAANWNEGIANHRVYFEAVRKALQEKYPDNAVRIIPAGPALAALNARIAAGQVPGMKDFITEIFADGIHLNSKGEYMVGLVHAACLLGVDPVDRALVAGAGLTREQARIFQQIAWETVVADPYSGIMPAP